MHQPNEPSIDSMSRFLEGFHADHGKIISFIEARSIYYNDNTENLKTSGCLETSTGMLVMVSHSCGRSLTYSGAYLTP